MRNETKIGIMAVLILAIAIWGYKFLQGKNILSSATHVFVEYDDVTELFKSAPVMKNGFQVGVVSDIYLKPENPDKVVVAITIDKSVKVPKNARAVQLSMGVMAGKGIELEFDQPCSGSDCISSGDYLQGETKGMLGSMIDPKEVPAYMDQLNEGIQKILTSLEQKMNEPGSRDSGIGKMAYDLQVTLENLKGTTNQLNSILAANSGNIKGLLSNLESVTGSLRNSNENISTMLANASQFSGQLASADVKGTMDKANGTLDETKAAIEGLKATLATVDKTFVQATGLLADINNGNGTLGKLVKDDVLYENLKTSTREVELLLQDVRLNPKRYTRFLSKKEKPYEVPVEDPAKN